eukprot:TRINITY_DN14298_c0_g1_i5.p6 TRINITY_DN14298_c0_g1~~TRINITY_DN14298_c0_g1_i5.p6  ORF type:complete len:142 (+),score=18.28 TRINITY_DN14298_c0_g1_i5:1999-2424(+)
MWLLGSRPFRRPCDCLLAPAFLGLEAAACAVQAWAFYSHVIPSTACLDACKSTVSGLLGAASAVMFLRVALMHAGAGTLILTGRRSQLQRLEWEETEARERGVLPAGVGAGPAAKPGRQISRAGDPGAGSPLAPRGQVPRH